MNWTPVFLLNSGLLGVGLAMDAFSVSLANGLNEPGMSGGKTCAIAGVFGFFQALMPMLGWICVRTVIQSFRVLERGIPWIALILLLGIGVKMILEGVRSQDIPEENPGVGPAALLLQGIATSIDALSAGVAIAEYPFPSALACSLIIAAVTFVLCLCGVVIGRRFGTRLAGKSAILGGIILIAIGIKIFFTGVF